jgi:hypothetical protein
MQQIKRARRLGGGMVRIEFAVLREPTIELQLVLGYRRGNNFSVDGHGRIVTLECHESDCEDALRAYARPRSAKKLIEEFRATLTD